MTDMFKKPKQKTPAQKPTPGVTDAERTRQRATGYSRKTGRSGRASTIFDSGGSLG